MPKDTSQQPARSRTQTSIDTKSSAQTIGSLYCDIRENYSCNQSCLPLLPHFVLNPLGYGMVTKNRENQPQPFSLSFVLFSRLRGLKFYNNTANNPDMGNSVHSFTRPKLSEKNKIYCLKSFLSVPVDDRPNVLHLDSTIRKKNCHITVINQRVSLLYNLLVC